MDDTISKLAVIQIIEKMRARIGHNLERSVGRAMIEILDEVGEDIGKLPPAQPEQKKGTWILDRSGAYCCSECMEPCAGYVMMRPRDKFCKMCGAKMEDSEDETD